MDDDTSITLVVCAALKKIGMDVLEAENGSKSIELFQENKPDIILMDVIMPDMDGFKACRTIRSLPGGRYVQILMVTGLEDAESTQKAFDAGADGFLTKPINFSMLSQQVQYSLRAGQAFRELHISRSRLAKAQELAKIGHWQMDFRSDLFFCSPEAAGLLGLAEKTDIKTLDAFLQSIVAKDQLRIQQALEIALKDKEAVSLEYRILDRTGSMKHILNTSQIILNEDDEPVIQLGIVQDVTQLKEAEEEIRFLAFYDGLTGLANRMLFMDRLDQAISDAKRNDRHFALLFLDLDHFKRVNDTLGHHIGDLLLKKIAHKIRTSIRSTDSATRIGKQTRKKEALVARLGGDEFTILITDLATPELAAPIARRLLSAIPAVYFLEGHEVSITTSIGISVFPEDGTDAEILLKHADTAMYHAKDKGRNTYQFFRESMNKAVFERFTIEKDLKRAIRESEFVLYYQPQIRLTDLSIVGAEALIRWNHPHHGIVFPDKFIPIAEESGIITDINQWVLDEACRQSTQWKDEGLPPIKLSINMSGYQLSSQNMAENLLLALDRFDVAPENIEIEFTENILLQDTDSTRAILANIKKLNLRIALDDFGTGYSSLSYLTSFPVDTLKIDRSFVMGCTINKNNLVIIRAIVAMGHTLDKKIIAEGVETKEQFEILKNSGCDEAQGYYFSRPLPCRDFGKMLLDAAPVTL